ncbi:hypothetical protein ABGB12_03865 [Actinocorallia sp. B10E7]|uniref:hypothetical protein n=1 Tax=Actinocorallia sp. B10E7 TaxID=3153558 RepID=UPI00325DDD4A
MEVFFADGHLAALCGSHRGLRAKYGDAGAKKVLQRLRLLRQAEDLDEIMAGPGKCHPLKGAYYQDCHALRLHGGFRLVFRLMTDKEKAEAGVITQNSALVIQIIDYHEG